QRGQLYRVRGVLEIRSDLQDVHKPVKSGNAFLVEPAEVDQLLDGIDEYADTQQGSHQISQPQGAMHYGDAANDDDGNGQERGGSNQAAGEVGLAPVTVTTAGEKATVGVGKLHLFGIFVGEGLYHANPGKRVF